MWGKWVHKWKNRLLAAALVVFLAGCQASGGVDLNAMLMNQLDIRSAEQTGSLELIIDWNEQYIEDNEDARLAALAQLLSHVKVDITRSVADEAGRAYAEGTVSFGGRPPIGFVLRADETSVYMEVEGFKRPLLIDLSEIAGEDAASAAIAFNGAVDEITREMAKAMGAYFIRHLPNPPVLDIKRETVTVGGRTETMTKVHAEIKGDALGEWLIKYVDALLEDEEGLREMMRAVTEKLKELNELDEAYMEEAGIPDEEADEALEELEYFADEGFDEILPLLQEARNGLEMLRQSDQWRMIFDEGIVLTMDVWVDDRLHIRKSDMELVIAPAVLKIPFAPLHSVTLRTSEEYWNINGKVEIPQLEAIEAMGSAWGIEDLMHVSKYSLLHMLEEDSVLYDLLKNEFQIDDSRFSVSPYNFYGTAPFIAEDGTLYVPLRNTLEEFGITVGYDHDRREIRFYDEGTAQEFVLYLDSTGVVLVNGEEVPLSRPLVINDGYSYMVAGDLFQLLRAVYTYEKDEYDDVWVNVERDL